MKIVLDGTSCFYKNPVKKSDFIDCLAFLEIPKRGNSVIGFDS